ncbi:MAG: RsmE family RNA methyltransferase, partial [Xanthomonadales bacterium]|nr:RsmE family RNA methyltransferase [Xanthomonadales bacterium]
ISACEQCGRTRLPVIEVVQTLPNWRPTATGLRLALNPQANLRVRDLALTETSICLVVGPEGGLGESDMAALHNAGFAGLRLGPRILRSETAGLVALAALQAAYGDL